jgi:hypothetical protein
LVFPITRQAVAIDLHLLALLFSLFHHPIAVSALVIEQGGERSASSYKSNPIYSMEYNIKITFVLRQHGVLGLIADALKKRRNEIQLVAGSVFTPQMVPTLLTNIPHDRHVLTSNWVFTLGTTAAQIPWPTSLKFYDLDRLAFGEQQIEQLDNLRVATQLREHLRFLAEPFTSGAPGMPLGKAIVAINSMIRSIRQEQAHSVSPILFRRDQGEIETLPSVTFGSPVRILQPEMIGIGSDAV